MATKRGLELAKKIWGWEPHSQGQADWLLCEAKEKTAACGRRWGKSESTAIDIVLFALERPNTIQIVIAPTDDQTKTIMEEVSRRLSAIPGIGGEYEERLAPYREVRFRDGKGLTIPTQILSRTGGTTGRGLRGKKAHRVITDEDAFIPRYVIENAVTPLLADYGGQHVRLSTPLGLNHFFESYQRGQDAGQSRSRSFRFPSSANPYLSSEFLENERRVKPDRVYAQEYEAAFMESEGAVFRRVHEATRNVVPQEKAVPGHRYTFGVDWGRTGDFTVIAVYDETLRQIVKVDRFTGIGFDLQLSRLQTHCAQFRPTGVIVEVNSIGTPQIERAQTMGLPVVPFTTTNASKSAVVDLLSLKLDRQEIGILDDPVVVSEMLAYASDRLPSGLMRYSAPEGLHDDTVMAIMLAVWGAESDIGPIVTAGAPRPGTIYQPGARMDPRNLPTLGRR